MRNTTRGPMDDTNGAPASPNSIAVESSWKRQLACLAALFLLAFPIFIHDSGAREICDVREERVAITAREMWRAGEWILPTMNGEPRLQKPPLAYWLPQTFAVFRGSFDETTLWLPFGITAILCLFFTYGIAASIGGWRLGLLAACLLLTMPLFANAGTTASADIVLTLAATAAWFFHLQARRRGPGAKWEITAFYVCLGFGALAKGPVILLFTLLPILAEATFTRSLTPLRSLRSMPGIALFLVLSLAWPVLVSLRAPPTLEGISPTREWVLESFGKIFQSDGSDAGYAYAKHPEPWYFYLLRIVPLFGLGGLVLIASAMGGVRRLIDRRGSPSDAVRYRPVGVWFWTGLLFFSLFTEKKGFYLAPLAPAAATLAAGFIEDTFGIWRRLLRPLGWVAAGASALALLVFTGARIQPELLATALNTSGLDLDILPELLRETSAYLQLTAAAAFAGSLTITWIAGKSAAKFLRSTLIPATFAFTATFALMAFPYKKIHYASKRDEWVAKDARAVRSQLEPGQKLYSAGRTPAGLLFYLDHRVQRMNSSAPTPDIPSGSGFFISEATLKDEGLLPGSAAATEAAADEDGLLDGYTFVQMINADARSDRERILYFEKRVKVPPYRTRASNA